MRVRGRGIAAAVAVLALAALAAAAQDLYYLEAEKDGRLYVFADKAVHDRWAKGKSLPRPSPCATTDRGAKTWSSTASRRSTSTTSATPGRPRPPGRARRPRPPAPAGPPAPRRRRPRRAAPATPRVRWDHGTTFAFDDALRHHREPRPVPLHRRVPSRHPAAPGHHRPGRHKPSFKIRRAKTELAGWLLWKELTYQFQVGWAGSDSGAGRGHDLQRPRRRLPQLGRLEDAASSNPRGAVQGAVRPAGVHLLREAAVRGPLDPELRVHEEPRRGGHAVGRHGRGAGSAWALGAFNGNQRNRPPTTTASCSGTRASPSSPAATWATPRPTSSRRTIPSSPWRASSSSNDRHGVTNANDFERPHLRR